MSSSENLVFSFRNREPKRVGRGMLRAFIFEQCPHLYVVRKSSLLLAVSALCSPALLFWSETSGKTNLVNHTPPYDLPAFAQIVGALGSLVLSAGLVYLYRRQTMILNEEKKQTEFQSKALLRIEDLQVIPAEKVSEYATNNGLDTWPHLLHADLVEVTLSNFGRAPAEELRVEAMLNGNKIGWESQGPLIQGEWKTALKKMTGPRMDAIRLNDQGGVIGTNEREKVYTTSLHAVTDEIEEQLGDDVCINETMGDNPPGFLSASELLWIFQDSGESEIDAGVRLWYKDGLGDRRPIRLGYTTVESKNITDFHSVIFNARPMMPDDVPEENKWWEKSE